VTGIKLGYLRFGRAMKLLQLFCDTRRVEKIKRQIMRYRHVMEE